MSGMPFIARVYVASRTSTTGKQHLVFVHPSLAYVWDKVFEDMQERHGHDILPEDKPRKFYFALARKMGYKVRRGIVSVPKT